MSSGDNDLCRTIEMLDSICKKILKTLCQNCSFVYDYASIQRRANIGSHRTVKNHMYHLENMGLVEINKEEKGQRTYYKISLTGKGKDCCKYLGGEK